MRAPLKRYRVTEQEVSENVRLNLIQKRRDEAAARHEPKAPERDTIPRDVKNEIENLRRLAQHIQDRLHELAKR